MRLLGLWFYFEMHEKTSLSILVRIIAVKKIAKIVCHAARLYWICVYMRRTNMF